MQKLARDEFKKFRKGAGSEISQCEELAKKLGSHKGSPENAWNQEWEAVYELAEAVMKRVEREGISIED